MVQPANHPVCERDIEAAANKPSQARSDNNNETWIQDNLAIICIFV